MDHNIPSSQATKDRTLSTAGLERQLGDAITRRDMDELWQLIDNEAFKAIPESGQSGLLCKALDKGFPAGALAILEQRSATSLTTPDGTSLLSLAARAGALPVCEALIERGAQVDGEYPHIGTPLCEAASMGHAAVCSYLLTCGADVNRSHSAGSGSPLKRAVFRDAVDVCRVLVDAGADPAATKPEVRHDDLTPFQTAIAFSTTEVASFFIDSFPHLLFESTLDGRTMVEIAENANRPLVLAAMTASAISNELGQEVGYQNDRRSANGFGPL